MTAERSAEALPPLQQLLRRFRRRRWASAAAALLAVWLLLAHALLPWLVSWEWTTRSAIAAVVVVLMGLLFGTLAGAPAVTAAGPWRPWRLALLPPARDDVHHLEVLVPQARNLLVTAAELRRAPSRPPAAVRDDVLARADALAAALDVTRLVPLAPALRLLGGALALAMLSLGLQRRHAATGAPQRLATAASAVRGAASGGITRVTVRVVPPGYRTAPVRTLVDPVRVEAVVGSRLELLVESRADSLVLETLTSRRVLRPEGPGRFRAQVAVDADGFIALAPQRLVGVVAVPDPLPRVRVVTPGRDLLLRDSLQALDVAIEAEDDHALAMLALRWVRVSGSGERFTFTEGEVPVRVLRQDGRRWSARARWELAPLALEPGDMVVYRAVAADRRPGSVLVESDAFLAQRPAIGGEAAAGFALDPDDERSALSQQMVILKTERLEARRATLPPEAFAQEAAAIAAEQRRVRAEFVFMMGGEFAELVTDETAMGELDETHEAEAETDLSAGRMVNRGRVSLLGAVRAMSRAAVRLTESDTRGALVQEREAVRLLEEAFARSRFLLRALSQRERIDLARRLTGALDDARGDRAPESGAAVPPRVVALRAAFAQVASLEALGDAPRAAAATAAAAALLRLDATDPQLRTVATRLQEVATLSAAGRSATAREAATRALGQLTALLRGDLPMAPRAGRGVEQRALDGALTDALRGGATPP